MPQLAFIPLDKIRVNKVALRDVNRKADDFTELTNSVRSEGVTSAISVKHKPGEDGKEYELVDGLQRFSASQDVGTGVVDRIPDPAEQGKFQRVGRFVDSTDNEGKPVKVGVIPAQVIDRDEAETIVTQIIANAHRIETKPTEYANAIFKYLGYNPTFTLAQVAAKLNKSPVWLEKQLSLLKLIDAAKPLVNEGKIPLANAYVMAKMPPEEQPSWLERAQTLESNKFSAAGLERIKQIRDANRKGVEAGAEQFVAVAHIRKKPELEGEVGRPEIGPALIRDLNVVKDIKPSPAGLLQAASAGFQLGLQWALSMDPKSVESAKKKWEDRKKADSEAKVRRDAEKATTREKELQQKTKEAAEIAEKARKAAAQLPPLPAPTAAAPTPELAGTPA